MKLDPKAALKTHALQTLARRLMQPWHSRSVWSAASLPPLSHQGLLASKGNHRAFTKVDLLIVAATLVLLITVVLPYFARSTARSSKINCVNNLKQVGLAFRIFASDNNDLFPMAISMNEGGTAEHMGPSDVFRHFQVMSNELASPLVLTCPNDIRPKAYWFTNLSNTNISYFVGLDAEEANPRSILSGDRNLTRNGKLISGLFPITTNTVLGWSSGIHQHAGNIAMGDGSVQQVTSNTLVQAIRTSGGPNRLHLP